MTDDEKQDIYDDFYDNVNMTPYELEDWLDTDESKSVGKDSGDGESVGHKSGRKIVKIKRKKKEELTETNYKHMNKVNGYVARHTAQRPDGDVKETDWYYSLKN
ncbi:DUF3140 domain-containing protein [Winogradskyella maritima]|uniref:DUF3140 domain-containing protein n=1 Tax=Winogradskyella maritima TaxID=1517766 RepID=A0ABV8AJ45_9FLAO|nr:DUF3140 domain-containing protein [Winogradskyella maritima]